MPGRSSQIPATAGGGQASTSPRGHTFSPGPVRSSRVVLDAPGAGRPASLPLDVWPCLPALGLGAASWESPFNLSRAVSHLVVSALGSGPSWKRYSGVLSPADWTVCLPWTPLPLFGDRGLWSSPSWHPASSVFGDAAMAWLLGVCGGQPPDIRLVGNEERAHPGQDPKLSLCRPSPPTSRPRVGPPVTSPWLREDPCGRSREGSRRPGLKLQWGRHRFLQVASPTLLMALAT